MSTAQLSFDDVQPVVGSTRQARPPTQRELLAALQTLAGAARRTARRLPNRLGADLRAAIEAVDQIGEIDWEPATNGTSGSTSAALLIAPSTGSQRRLVLELIGRHQPVTDEQLEEFSGRKHQTISARRRELVLGGFVDVHSMGVNNSGAQATRWMLTPWGRQALSAP